MAFNPYMYEKLLAARHEEILHNVQQSRLLVQVEPRRRPARYIVSILYSLLMKRESQTRRSSQQSSACPLEG